MVYGLYDLWFGVNHGAGARRRGALAARGGGHLGAHRVHRRRAREVRGRLLRHRRGVGGGLRSVELSALY